MVQLQHSTEVGDVDSNQPIHSAEAAGSFDECGPDSNSKRVVMMTNNDTPEENGQSDMLADEADTNGDEHLLVISGEKSVME